MTIGSYLTFWALLGTALKLSHTQYVMDGKIVGGHDVSIKEHPYQVSFQMMDIHFCGGSIIGKKHILTAAHCTSRFRNFQKYLTIRAGSQSTFFGGQVVRISAIYQHPSFDSATLDNDVSVVALAEELVFGLSVQPIAVAKALPRAGTLAICTGWGTLKYKGAYPQKLQSVDLRLLPKSICGAAYAGDITEKMFCAAAPGKDACQADSGGPLVTDGAQIGVVSWGSGCANPDRPGVYTNVAAVRRFIVENSDLKD